MDKKVYQKIGMFQSVAPVPEKDAKYCCLSFGKKRLWFHFKDSGAVENDGLPIWVAESVRTY